MGAKISAMVRGVSRIVMLMRGLRKSPKFHKAKSTLKERRQGPFDFTEDISSKPK